MFRISPVFSLLPIRDATAPGGVKQECAFLPNNDKTHPHLLPAHRQVFNSSASRALPSPAGPADLAIEWSKVEWSPVVWTTLAFSQGRGSFDVVVASVRELQTESEARDFECPVPLPWRLHLGAASPHRGLARSISSSLAL